jgi:hypothetical protein
LAQDAHTLGSLLVSYAQAILLQSSGQLLTLAVVMDTMAILMATTMVTGIVIIVVQGVALAIGDEIKEQRGNNLD